MPSQSDGGESDGWSSSPRSCAMLRMIRLTLAGPPTLGIHVAADCTVPIRLMQTPTTCRMLPLASLGTQSTPSGCMRKADRHGLYLQGAVTSGANGWVMRWSKHATREVYIVITTLYLESIEERPSARASPFTARRPSAASSTAATSGTRTTPPRRSPKPSASS